MNKIIFTALVILTLCQTGFAQDLDKTKLDNYFNALEMNSKFMGGVVVSKGGAIVYSNYIGYSDFENKVKANENSKYRIGSISKSFTAVLILKGYEDKKLSLDHTIEKYFPAIKNANKITIRHLLSHRSGLHNFTDDKDYLSWNTQPKTEKEMIEIIAKAGNDFPPDSMAKYSNSNFVLLTYILEKTFKKSYAELLQKYIIQPVGLKNTCFGGKINPVKNECNSYSYKDTWKAEPETDISIPLGAGGIVSTPGDLTKFSYSLFGGKLLKPESLELMKTIKDRYGIGLLQFSFYDKVGYGHPGGIDGFRSAFFYFAEGNISYAITSNGMNFNLNNITIAVLSAIYGKPYDLPVFSLASYNVSPEDLDKYMGIYSSTQIPLKITITKDIKTLIAQATDQPAFPLEAIEKDKFKFEQAGAVFEFRPEEKTMILIQGDGKFTFTKE